MSKLIQKIEDEIAFQEGQLFDKTALKQSTFHPMEKLSILRAFLAFATDSQRDLTAESFSEYEQNALAVWEDE